MSLASCRYNPNHKMKQTRLLIHEEQCPDKKGKVLKTCPFNPIHKVSPDNYDKHKKSCPNAPKVDKDLEDEMREYIRNRRENPSWGDSEETFDKLPTKYGTKISDSRGIELKGASSFKSDSVSQPIGVRKVEEEKQLKKERKNKQREMMNLIENSAMDIESQFSVADKEIDSIYDQEFVNFNVQNPVVLDESLGESQFNRILDNLEQNTEYDPNASDLLIGKQNRNNFKFPQKSEVNYTFFSDNELIDNSMNQK